MKMKIRLTPVVLMDRLFLSKELLHNGDGKGRDNLSAKIRSFSLFSPVKQDPYSRVVPIVSLLSELHLHQRLTL